MGKDKELETYLTKGLERMVAQTVRSSLTNPRGSAFLLRFAAAAKAAAKRREAAEKAGGQAPLFLTAKVTDKSDLSCPPCQGQDWGPRVTAGDSEEWLQLFEKADKLGVSFIFLTGGEPLLRRDVIKAAGKKQNILFPIFTSGQSLDERYLALMERCRNLVPVLELEGGKESTDARRGEGVFDRQLVNMKELKDRGLLFGALVRVSADNLEEVLAEDFAKDLAARGCKALLYATPKEKAGEETGEEDSAEQKGSLGEEGQVRFQAGLEELRAALKNILLIHWPRDLKGL